MFYVTGGQPGPHGPVQARNILLEGNVALAPCSLHVACIYSSVDHNASPDQPNLSQHSVPPHSSLSTPFHWLVRSVL